MDNHTSLIVNHSFFMMAFTMIAILSVIQLIHDRLLIKRNEMVGSLQRMFHVLTLIAGISFIGSISVMFTALQRQGVMTGLQQMISDILFDCGVQCAFTGTFHWVNHNVQQQQFITISSSTMSPSSSSSSFTSLSSRSRLRCMQLGSSSRLTTILATICWVIAGITNISMYVTNMAWINAIYLLVLALFATILIAFANYSIYQILHAMAVTSHGLVTDATSERRRQRRMNQLKRFIRSFTFVYILIMIGIGVSVIDAFDDTSLPYAQPLPDDPHHYVYEFDPLIVLILLVLLLFVWYAWRPTTLLCACCVYVEPKAATQSSDHTKSGNGQAKASSARATAAGVGAVAGAAAPGGKSSRGAATTGVGGGNSAGNARSPKRASVNMSSHHTSNNSIGNRLMVIQSSSPIASLPSLAASAGSLESPSASLHAGRRIDGARATSHGDTADADTCDDNGGHDHDHDNIRTTIGTCVPITTTALRYQVVDNHTPGVNTAVHTPITDVSIPIPIPISISMVPMTETSILASPGATHISHASAARTPRSNTIGNGNSNNNGFRSPSLVPRVGSPTHRDHDHDHDGNGNDGDGTAVTMTMTMTMHSSGSSPSPIEHHHHHYNQYHAIHHPLAVMGTDV